MPFSAKSEIDPVQLGRYAPNQAWPMDSKLKCIQPGGGFVIKLEQLWGKVRRTYLRAFRKSYLAQMAAKRKGSFNPCPHPVLDPRDLKFYQNQGGYYWEAHDDPFTWRDHLPFVRAGLAELIVIGGGLFLSTLLVGWMALAQAGLLAILLWLIAATLAVFTGIVVWFFRNPRRVSPNLPGIVLSPADGKIVEITELGFEEYFGGPAVKIGIFLSLFNVHINRAPVAARVIGLKYQPGKYLNALRPESARENEQVSVMLEAVDHYRPMIVRQITGAVARRIVCLIKPNDQLQAGQPFGMIKLGSRTELIVPKEARLNLRVNLGEHVKAGTSILLDYTTAAGDMP
jgi:phosphatidylserine decarboxylase